nr:cyclin-J18 isoform X1 [Ipomoea batatas]
MTYGSHFLGSGCLGTPRKCGQRKSISVDHGKEAHFGGKWKGGTAAVPPFTTGGLVSAGNQSSLVGRRREMMNDALLRRRRVLGFLIQSAHDLHVSPIVKYSALSLFADRFYPSLSSGNPIVGEKRNGVAASRKGMDKENWLLDPMRESNLQLFALASVWISCKIHMSPPLSVKCLKSLGDKSITEQHFTTRDFLEAELLLMQVLKFEIGVSNITYRFLEDLVIQLKDVARVGEHMNFEACMDIMDLLYEKEDTKSQFASTERLRLVALDKKYMHVFLVDTLILVFNYAVVLVTSCKEQDIVGRVRMILRHVFEP